MKSDKQKIKAEQNQSEDQLYEVEDELDNSKKYIRFKKWGLEEHQKYLIFLRANKECFENQFTRRSEQVFKKLSLILDGRSATQCRTHHQKVLQKFGNDLDRTVIKALQVLQKKKKNAIEKAQKKELKLRKREEKRLKKYEARQRSKAKKSKHTNDQQDQNLIIKLKWDQKNEVLQFRINVNLAEMQFW